jgi:hypothetical protein
MGVEVTVRGQSDIFSQIVNTIKGQLPRIVANKFKKYLIENIERNRFNFELNPRWVSTKKSLGGDPRPFIMFGTYKNSIEVKKSGRHEYTVGFTKGKIHPRAKVEIAKLAYYLEVGDADKGVPARPLWRKSGDEFFHKRNRGLSKMFVRAIDKNIR